MKISSRNSIKVIRRLGNAAAVSAIIASSTIVSAEAGLSESCSNLFHGQSDGLLSNPAAQGMLIVELKKSTLAAGKYEAVMSDGQKQVLEVRYSDNAVMILTLDGMPVVTNLAVPKTTNADGSQSGMLAKMYLRSDNRVKISNTYLSGNAKTPNGAVEREVSVELRLPKSQTGTKPPVTVSVRETITTSVELPDGTPDVKSVTSYTDFVATSIQADGAKSTDTMSVSIPAAETKKLIEGPIPQFPK